MVNQDQREIRAHQDSQVYQEQMVQKGILVLGVCLVLLAPQGLQEETSSQTLRTWKDRG